MEIGRRFLDRPRRPVALCVATACPLVHVRGGAPEDIVSASTFPKEQVAVASKSTDVRPKITMACVDCKDRNYITKKNRRNNPDRLAFNKFCPKCGKHTEHRETR